MPPRQFRSPTSAIVACLVLISAAQAQDFNGNSIRDAIDIRSGIADCNRNGVPDSADIARPDFAAAVEHHSDISTLTNVSGVATVDFDQDGDLDVAVASRQGTSDSAITLWRNDGGPGLVYALRIPLTNAYCFMVRAADLNRDGRSDLVAGDAGFAQVIVLISTGPGTFAAPARLTASSRGTGIALGDIDNDGDIDIAFPCAATNSVDVFRNTGSGSFSTRTSYPCGQQPVAAALGDFTGDGLADIAVANSFISAPGSGTVTLLRNTGGAAFTAHATLAVAGHSETSSNSSPHDLHLADLDADGDRDLLVSSKRSNSLRIYSNNGSGTFSNTQTLGPLEAVGGIADRLLCVNLDADPALELAWCDSAARAVRVYDNQAGTFLLSQSFAIGSEGPVDLAAGDLSGDGLPELIAAGNNSYAFSTVLNRGGLNFDAVIHLRRDDMTFYPVLADFTGDGLTDLASYSTGLSPAFFHLAPGLGNQRFGPAVLVPIPTGGHVLPRDLNGDGLLDFLSLGNSGNRFAMLNSPGGAFGPPIFSSPINVNGNWQTADINNDGNLDMLWTRSIASNQPAFIAISYGDGQGGFAPPFEIVTPPFLGSVWTGDLSGDGFPELFVGVAAGIVGPLGFETVLVYPNNADGTFAPFVVHAYELQPNFTGSVGGFAWVDIDGDGDKDLLGQSARTYLYRNNNHQLAAPVDVGGLANYTINQFGPTIFDIDGDGDLDFFGSASISGIVSPAAFFNDGTGNFGGSSSGPRLALMRYRNAHDALAVGDADGNGRPDLLVKPQGFSDWYLHLNFASSATDCDASGTPDSCQIASGQLADSDLDGVPDLCDPPSCLPDFNADGTLNADDLADFINCFFAVLACPQADFNADSDTNGDDLADYINAYFVGCP